MVTEAATDRRLLTEQAYPDSTNLRARQSIYDFKVPLDDFWSFVLDQVDWPDGATVLDVGCGPGNYLRELGQRRHDLRLERHFERHGAWRTATHSGVFVCR